MTNLISALFTDNKKVDHAILELREKGYTREISVITKESTPEDSSLVIKSDIEDIPIVGGRINSIPEESSGAFMDQSQISNPSPTSGIFITGPLATILFGTTEGAISGSLTNALVDLGIPDQKANIYADKVQSGETLITVNVQPDKETEVLNSLAKNGAEQAEISNYD